MSLDRLDDLISRHAGGHLSTAVPRQILVREDRCVEGAALDYDTMLCVVTRGTKRTEVGGRSRAVERGEMLVSLVELPLTATFSSPYRSVCLLIDPEAVADVAPRTTQRLQSSDAGFTSASAGAPLLDALTRWVGLLDEPDAIGVLAPRYEEEVLYRVLTGPLGGVLLQAGQTGVLRRIRIAVRYLLDHYADDVAPQDLATMVAMSPSSFNRQFRAVTGMSPKQYQKHVRLERARRLLAQGAYTAQGAAAQVGYVSASHFNRDYVRHFGSTPRAHARITHGS
ncbi:AraC family transcriptional regulator [Allobranchiibius huperziae]|uniref:AraC-like DNA-binding protein n=1 Tax=Allobranchiibius huperziae TaxID=1874116 RepID=A0A853DES1_9MICO|nr:AraC family transcriptional regulator [Allobranchiibius huperziae]NYJ73180.1 AraC-like DNA-binding protein [Allobranchiibius huperziae]